MKPISTKDVAESLDFVKDKKKSANYFKSEYREISKEDFLKMIEAGATRIGTSNGVKIMEELNE